jgi:sialate O-acetylesterase
MAQEAIMSNAVTLARGLTDFQVLQRGRNGAAVVDVGGACRADGAVQFRLISRGGKAGAWRSCGKARAGCWSARLTLATGGPYELQFRVGADCCKLKNVLVGDLWVLAGQSNMEGVGDLDGRIEKPRGLVHSFGMDERWERAVEPLHWLNESVDVVHNAAAANKGLVRGVPAGKPWRNNRTKGAGCGLAFAQALRERSGVPIGLIPCAHGGTSMAQWEPSAKGQGGASLYGSMLRRVKACGGKVAGVAWYQGESDAGYLQAAQFVQANKRLVQEMRNELGGPKMPFLFVQIGRHFCDSNGAAWNRIQQLQIELEKHLSPAGMAAAVDLPMDDGIHIGTEGLNRLGRRLASVARRVALGDRSIQLGPRPVAARVEKVAFAHAVRVTFSGVNGRLVSAGEPVGFTVLTGDGTVRTDLYRTRLDGASVMLHLMEPIPSGSMVQYGRGRAPICNITDEADLAMPVFGPMPISTMAGKGS